MTQATATQTAPSPRLYTEAEVQSMLRTQHREMTATFEETVREFYAEKAAEFGSREPVPF